MADSLRRRLERLERQPGRPRPPLMVADLAESLKPELRQLAASRVGLKAEAGQEILRVAADAGGLRDLSDNALELLRELVEARYASLITRTGH